MSQADYKAFCGDLCKNFGQDWSKVGSKLDFAWEFLQHIPANAWQAMVRIAIDKWDSWPKNWSKSVKSVYEDWRRNTGTSGAPVAYNRDDDPRYPVGQMWQAFWLLHKHGYPQYRTFADQTGMPATDRARVENKHRIITHGLTSDFSIPEVGHRTNPKIDRPPWINYREPGEDD